MAVEGFGGCKKLVVAAGEQPLYDCGDGCARPGKSEETRARQSCDQRREDQGLHE